ncbi:hypothetical protein [Streptomyces sp. NPDC048606]|uniref:hypothetical protein n=1 Tax=Streptomyces sp. NPDC048606 TaxID=3154726 RepID=UPI00341AAD88
MSDETHVQESAEEGMRPCAFCNHPVVIDCRDEWDCQVCGVRDEDQVEVAGRDA